MPGASRLLRRLAAVKVNLGVVSSVGVLRDVAAGVTEVLLLGRADGTVAGSTDAAADLRDGGLDGGGLASVLVTADVARWELTGRDVDAGVDMGESL